MAEDCNVNGGGGEMGGFPIPSTHQRAPSLLADLAISKGFLSSLSCLWPFWKKERLVNCKTATNSFASHQEVWSVSLCSLKLGWLYFGE